jgi:hypothetical protein
MGNHILLPSDIEGTIVLFLDADTTMVTTYTCKSLCNSITVQHQKGNVNVPKYQHYIKPVSLEYPYVFLKRIPKNPSIPIIVYPILGYSKWREQVAGDLCCNIAASGNLELLKWVHTCGYGFKWDERTCAYAAKHGHFNVIKYARENGCKWDTNTWNYAAERCDIIILNWIDKRGSLWSNNSNDAYRRKAEGKQSALIVIDIIEFKYIYERMQLSSEYVKIVCKENSILFRCAGEYSITDCTLNPEEPIKFSKRKNRTVEGVFKLEDPILSKCALLCEGNLQLYMTNSYLIFTMKIGCNYSNVLLPSVPICYD